MRRLTCLVIISLLLIGATSYAGGVKRIDISPATLVNLAEGHGGEFMGGAITGDVFLSKNFALRTTIGFTKQRYYPADLSYTDADYGFWLSFAPYAELNVGNTFMPYAAVLGTFTAGTGYLPQAQPIGMETKPYARLSQAARNDSFYSLGVSLGSKLRVLGPVGMYGEVSHYFFTSVSDQTVFYGPEFGPFGREYDFERNPTYLSFGLTYSLDLAK